MTQKSINQNYFVVETRDPEDTISDAVDSQKAVAMDDGDLRDPMGGQNKKKNKKKNKK